MICDAFKKRVQNTLRGFADITMPSGMQMIEVAIHTKNGKAWASPPSKPMLDRDGVALRDARNKVRYSPIIDFATDNLRFQWSSAVVTAVVAFDPSALDGDGM